MSRDRVHAMILPAGTGAGPRPAGGVPRVAGRPLPEIWSILLRRADVAATRWADGGHATPGAPAASWADPGLADGADHVLIIRSGVLSGVDLSEFLEAHRRGGHALTVGRSRHGSPDLGVLALSADAYRAAVAEGGGLDAFAARLDAAGLAASWTWDGVPIDLDAPGGAEEAARRGAEVLTEALRPHRRGGRPAVFLDRDGTINVDVHYLSDPRDLRLIPGAASAIRRLGDAGYARVVVTNQSGVGRGYYSEEQLGRVHEALLDLLAAEGATVDAIYACTEAPASTASDPIEFLDRKPGPGMLYRAAEDLDLDIDSSWMVGDTPADLGAGLNARCRGVILVRTGRSPAAIEGAEPPARLAADLAAAADLILADSAAASKGNEG